MTSRRICRHLTLLLLLVALSACTPVVRDGQPGSEGLTRVLQPGQSMGQTFTARERGLNGVDVFLLPEQAGAGELLLHLRPDPHSQMDLAVSTLPLQQVNAPGFYRLDVPIQRDSRGRDYYAQLEIRGDGQVRVATAPGDAYREGALYQDGQPADAQMSFRLSYDPIELSTGLMVQSAEWLLVLGVSALLFVLPGWALLALLYRDWGELAWAERLGLASGLSIALYPLFLLWTAVIGLRLGALYAWLPSALAIAVIVWRNRAWRPAGIGNGWNTWRRSQRAWQDVALIIVIGVVAGTRLWAIRSLDAPMWGDSYQHTMIAQLLADHQGLFESWLPYAPYGTLTVQFGFSVLVTVFSWVTGWPVTSAILYVGQILNGLAVLALYPLALRLTAGNRWAGTGAVLIAGLVSPMPAFYVNWGRYAQLAGQAVLPISLWLLWTTVQSKEHVGRMIVLAGGALAGMLLAYYRAPFYYATFVVAWLIGWGLPHWGLNLRAWLRAGFVMALVGSLAFVLLVPWLSHLMGGALTSAVETGVVQGTPWEWVLTDYAVWGTLDEYVPRLLQVIAVLAFVWSLVQRQWVISALGLWVVGLASLVAGRLIHLPGANLLQNFGIVIALYMPVGFLGGWLIGQIAEWLTHRTRVSGGALVAAVLVGVAIWGGWSQRLMAQPQTYTIVTRPDVKAMAWIRDHVPANARFLVEGFLIYEGYSAVGSDGGWWIPLLSGRANTMPPQYALLNERPLEQDYTSRVVKLVAQLGKTPAASSAGAQLLCDWGVTHVYVGQLQGHASMEKFQLFAAADFADSPLYDLVYREDRVSIFALSPQACEAPR